MAQKPRTSDDEWRSALALALVETGFRNSRLEELHAGVSPTTAVGDYSDVKVVTPYGEIVWSRVSRLDDEEMKALMIEVADRVYTVLAHPEPFLRLKGAARWNRPQLDPAMMDVVARWEARAAGMAEDEVFATWPHDSSKQRPPIRAEQRAPADQVELERPDKPSAFETTPEAMRELAEAPIADPVWIARAREALRLGSKGWERSQLEALDAWEEASYGQD